MVENLESKGRATSPLSKRNVGEVRGKKWQRESKPGLEGSPPNSLGTFAIS